ncbi:MAG: DUF1800 domain-containing protein [Saprospiraceae bacterium]|nr:DUF1800 domain-containing protein [Saprospiraceae bacterium]
MAGFSNFSLDPYEGVWTTREASHLLRRTMYSPSKDDIADAAAEGLDNIVSRLLQGNPLPDLPINFYYDEDPFTSIGESWVNKPMPRADNTNQIRRARVRSISAWTMGLALEEGVSIREKMTLFWHNHFVTGDERDPNFIYKNITLYRQNFLGNFRELTKQTTIDPSMLRYLNGNQNTRFKPNENYARELLELFTIGKGPTVGEGDYTNYTEHDVAEIAKVLTGWRDKGYLYRVGGELPGSFFTTWRHDTTTKKLSHRFGEIEIPNMGEQEYSHLIDIIFEQEEVSRFIARKIYRWFVYYDIDDVIEKNVIYPMSEILRENDYEMYPMVEALLKSQHFYDSYAIGSLIKNPLDFLVGTVKQLEIDLGTDMRRKYQLWLRIGNLSELLQMSYFTPPNVAGWKAYYQEPLYYRTWINSTTLSLRFQLTNLLINGVEAEDIRIGADVLGMIEKIEGADDPIVLIDQLAALVLPEEITDDQKSYLKSILLPGLPDYEWTVEYNEYLANPNNRELKTAVENRLRGMIAGMMSLPEYQLS